MATNFTVDIVTPEKVVVSEPATSLVAPGVMGSFGVLPNHAPLLTELEIGELRYRRPGGEEVRMAIGGGFLQIFNNSVTVLADSAERAEEIDVDRARRSRDAAREQVRTVQGSFNATAIAEAEAAYNRAANRIRVAGG